jgi:hypothetical protein
MEARQMKNCLVFAFLALGVLLFSGATTPANAASCIQFTNFCDQITYNSSADGTLYGMWDWQCDGGVSATNILGTQHPVYMGTRPSFSDGTAYTYTFWFLFKGYRPQQGFNMYGTDGSTEFVQQADQPFTVHPGACNFAGPNNGKPSLAGLQ